MVVALTQLKKKKMKYYYISLTSYEGNILASTSRSKSVGKFPNCPCRSAWIKSGSNFISSRSWLRISSLCLPHAPLRFWFNNNVLKHVKIVAILEDFQCAPFTTHRIYNPPNQSTKAKKQSINYQPFIK